MNLFDAIFRPKWNLRTAILFEQRQITYSELREEALLMARVLGLGGLERGDRVAILLNDSPEFVSSFISICAIGAIAVPVNMGLRTEDQKAIVRDCTARTVILETAIGDAFLTDAGRDLPSLEHFILVSRNAEEADITTEGQRAPRDHRKEKEMPKVSALKELIQQACESPSDIGTFPELRQDEPSLIFYTSGSTGEPKGAVHRQSDIFYTNQTYCQEVLQLNDDDRIFSSSRLPFSYGFGNAFSFPLLNGCTTILCREKPTPEIIANIFTTYRATIFFGVPVVYRSLLEHHRSAAPLDCSSLRFCVSAGEALPAPLGEDWQKTFGVEVLDGIGSTEMLHMWMSNHQGDVRYGSSGKLLNGYQAQLLDPEGAPTPAGEEGNLWVQGESAAMGYWNKPEVSGTTFVDGWVRTGDLYRQDGDGYWYHMGRSDDCFKSSGQWVSPVEVEGLLLRHDGISRAAVVEDFDIDGLPCACAYVVQTESNGDREGIERDLRELARASLPRFKQPRRYVFVDELPYTATGKIQRFKLRQDRPKPNAQRPKSAGG